MRVALRSVLLLVGCGIGCGRVGFDAPSNDFVNPDAQTDAGDGGAEPVLPDLGCAQQTAFMVDSLGGDGLSATVAGSTVVVVWKNGGETQALAVPATGMTVQRVIYENVLAQPSVTAVGQDVVVAAFVDTGATFVQRLDQGLVALAPRQAVGGEGVAVGPRALATAADGGVILLGSLGTLTLRHLDRDGVPLGTEVIGPGAVTVASVRSDATGYALAWADSAGACNQAQVSPALSIGSPIDLRATMQATCVWADAYDVSREIHLELDPAGAAVYVNQVGVTPHFADISLPRATRSTDGGWAMWSDPDGVKVLQLTTRGEPAGPPQRLDDPSPRFDILALGSDALAIWRSGSSLVFRRLCATP